MHDTFPNIEKAFIKIQGFYLIFFRKRLRKRLHFLFFQKHLKFLSKICATLKNVKNSSNCIISTNPLCKRN